MNSTGHTTGIYWTKHHRSYRPAACCPRSSHRRISEAVLGNTPHLQMPDVRNAPVPILTACGDLMATFSGDHNAGTQIGESSGDISIYNFGPSASEQQLRMRQECHQLFRLVGAKDEGYEWYKDRIHDRIDGTCEWFLTHVDYKSWISRQSGPLLVSADPGCGKSVLAKFLVDHELTGTVCYFFFKDKDQNTLRQALCALLHQLISKQPHLVDCALPEYKENGDRLAQLSHVLWRILVRATEKSTAGPVTFVLDALDECEEADMKEIFRLLTNLFSDDGTSGDQVKFLLTTRPYQSVVTELWRLSEAFPNIRIPGEDYSEQISAEVNLVVKDQVLRLARKFKLNDSITEHLERKLLSIKHRTYLWVYLVFNYLNQGFRKTLGGIEDAIEHVPENVYQAYEGIFLKSTNQARARRAFEIIIAASRPLTLHEMNIASCIEQSSGPQSLEGLDLEDDEDFKVSLRGYCGLFISIHHEKVYLLHQTAREFLLGLHIPEKAMASSGSQNWHGSISLQEAHSTLTAICLNFVLFSNFTTENFPDLPRLLFPRRRPYALSGKTMRSLKSTLTPPIGALEVSPRSYNASPEFRGRGFLLYSCMNWDVHVLSAGITDKSEIISLAIRACSPKNAIGLWIEHRLMLTFNFRDEILPLAIAAATGLDVIVKRLADTEDVNRQNAAGMTALHYSVLLDYRTITETLLHRGADVSIPNRSGQTSLHFAVLKHRYPDIQTYFPRLSEKDRTGTIMSSKQLPIFEKSVLKLLVQSGAEVNTQDKNGLTALHMAIEALNSYTLWLLGEDASSHSRVEADIRCLLENGAEVNTKDNMGKTALHLAAFNRASADIVTLLLEYHIDINIEDAYGRTPLYIAERYDKGGSFEAALRAAGGEVHEVKDGGQLYSFRRY